MFLLYFALWIIFNGAITLEICLFGIGVAAVMFAFTCKFMDYSIARERQVLRRFFSVDPLYFCTCKGDHQGKFCGHPYDSLGKGGAGAGTRTFYGGYADPDREGAPGKCDYADARDDYRDASGCGLRRTLSR